MSRWALATHATGLSGTPKYTSYCIRASKPGEIVKIQLKHIDFRPVKFELEGEKIEVLQIALPPSVSKGGKTTGKIEHVYAGTERLKEELVKRRFALRRKPDAYVFGTEDGWPIKNFKRMWRELFRLAGLDYGRSKGLTWHTIRHEFVSRTLENTGDPVVAQELARHKDLRPRAICTRGGRASGPLRLV